MLGTAVACGLGLILGQAAVDRLGSHETIEGVVALLLGGALMVAGVGKRGGSSPPVMEPGRGGGARHASEPHRAGCGTVGGWSSGVRRAERLVLTVLAMTAVSDGTLGDVERLVLVVLYVAMATLVVSVPVVSVVVAGDRAAAQLERAESWLSTHSTRLRVWLALVLGGALVVDGLVRLLG